eukprot:s3347_g12.t1
MHRIDACAKAARAFLEFLYTGALPNEDFEASNAASGRIAYLSDLMYLAEQYEAPNLTTICASQLARLLCKENVAEILRLLRQYKTHHPSVNRIFEQQVRNMRAYDELLLNFVAPSSRNAVAPLQVSSPVMSCNITGVYRFPARLRTES